MIHDVREVLMPAPVTMVADKISDILTGEMSFLLFNHPRSDYDCLVFFKLGNQLHPSRGAMVTNIMNKL